VARRVRDAGGSGWPARRGADRQHACEGAPLCCRRKRGACFPAIGVSRGGRNTKPVLSEVEGVHAITDGQGRPLAFLLTPGQAADCKAAEQLLDKLPTRCIVHADRAYDSNRIRDLIEETGAVPNIPPKRNRRWKSCFSKTLCKGRNAIERMFCRLKPVLSLSKGTATASPPATTNSPPTSSATSISPPPSCGGYESWP